MAELGLTKLPKTLVTAKKGSVSSSERYGGTSVGVVIDTGGSRRRGGGVMMLG